jgi:NADH:ubiquinone oxidoreductase subunit 5 (subunit L)/multisubunit Na+/H+ antiporter MnhA subunit
VGVLALAAVPPLGAAWSKEAVTAAAVHADAEVGALTLLAGLLSAAYGARWYLFAFGPGGPGPQARGSESGARRRVPRPTAAELAGMGTLAIASLLAGVLWLPGAGGVVERLSGRGLYAGQAWEAALSFALAAAGLAAGARAASGPRAGAFGLPERWRALVADWFGLPQVVRVLAVDPALAAAAALARFDERVVDAGVRAAAAVASGLSRTLAAWGERGIDGVVEGLAAGTLRAAGRLRTADDAGVDRVVEALAGATMAAARASQVADDTGVDAAVERLADGVGVAGQRLRLAHSGLTHRYYVLVCAGAVALAAVALWR